MDKQQIDACLRKLASLKNQLLGRSLQIGHLNPKEKNSRRKVYRTVDFLWLNIVLTLLGFVHIREKRNYLAMLTQRREGKALSPFQELMGIEGLSKKLPSIGVFGDSVQYFYPVELEAVKNKARRAIKFIDQA